VSDSPSSFLPIPSYKHAAACFLAAFISLVLAGCGGHKQAKVKVPPAPTIELPPATAKTQPQSPSVAKPATPKPAPVETEPEPEEDKEALAIPKDTKPVLTETGLASWYGAPFHNRRGSNGEIYDMNALTAAHRTLPLGTIVRVTNVKTGSSALVRITDRGPFIEGRILDLSMAAAKKVDVWKAGVARVKLEVLKTPSSLDGGRWAIQIGGFDEEDVAQQFADSVARRYRTAKVLSYASPAGSWWVRIRVKDDDHKRAQELARDTHAPQGSIFLVRLD
jgi:rare lipoprotein A